MQSISGFADTDKLGTVSYQCVILPYPVQFMYCPNFVLLIGTKNGCLRTVLCYLGELCY